MIAPGQHHQPARLVFGAQRRIGAVSPDRLCTLEGFGLMPTPGIIDEAVTISNEDEFGHDDTGYGDTDWLSLVSEITKAAGKITPAALELANRNANKKGGSAQDYLNAAQRQASGFSGTTLAVGGGLLALGLLAFFAMVKR